MDPSVQRILDAYNGRASEAFDALLTDDVVLVRNEVKGRGRDAFKAVVAKLWEAFPDLQYRIDDAVVTSDRIAMRWQASGTHRGEYFGVKPTGRTIGYSGITLYELRDGRIARAWVAADLLTLLRGLLEERAKPGPEARP
jgi:steroid delta-isomerase-like uncharacterized protein